MANTYVWKINQLSHIVKNNNRVVTEITWTYEASNDAVGALSRGRTAIDFDSTQPFTEYADLSEDQVKAWLIFALGDEKIKDMQKQLDKQIADLMSPSVGNGLPWV